MKRCAVFAVLALSVSLGWPARAANNTTSSATGTLLGQVSDATTNRPIAGAQAKVDANHQAVANNGGVFTIKDLPVGVVTVAVTATGYEAGTARATLKANATTPVKIALKPVRPSVGAVVGIVKDAATSKPLAGAVVRLGPAPTATGGEANAATATVPVRETVTGRDGGYAFRAVPVGSYQIGAAAREYVPSKPQAITVVADKETKVEIALKPIQKLVGTISGIVKDAATGKGIAGALVKLCPAAQPKPEQPVTTQAKAGAGEGVKPTEGNGTVVPPPAPKEIVTGADGTFVIKDVPAGAYLIGALARGYEPPTPQAITVVADKETKVEIALTPVKKLVGTISGVVKDAATGKGIAGALVKLCPAAQPKPEQPVTTQAKAGAGEGVKPTEGNGTIVPPPAPKEIVTGADGTFVIKDVPAGAYLIGALARGYAPPTPQAITVVADKETKVEIALKAASVPTEPKPSTTAG